MFSLKFDEIRQLNEVRKLRILIDLEGELGGESTE